MLLKVVQQNGAHECIHHQSNILLSRYSSQSCNIINFICLALPANASAPEKTQCAQSSANEKSYSSTGTKIVMILFS